MGWWSFCYLRLSVSWVFGMQSPSLNRLIYRSISTISSERGGAFEEIIKSSARNNRRDGLTGALVLLDGCFVQVLEGERAKVDTLMDRVGGDPRHRGLVILGDWPITARLFAGFSMARLDPLVLSPETARFVTEGSCGYQLTSTLAALRDKNFNPYQNI